MRSVARYVVSEQPTPLTGATPCRREAVLTTSPVTNPSPSARPGADGDDRLARVDPDAHLERERRVLRVQLGHRLQDAKAGPDGALRVVLVRDRRAEDGHHRVADELLHGAPVALDLLAEAREVRADAGADVLGVGLLRGGSEADEVAE